MIRTTWSSPSSRDETGGICPKPSRTIANTSSDVFVIGTRLDVIPAELIKGNALRCLHVEHARFRIKRRAAQLARPELVGRWRVPRKLSEVKSGRNTALAHYPLER